MNKLIRKFSALILVALIVFGASPVADIPSITASAFSYSGSCGAQAVWTLDDETGLLTISGSGETDDSVPLNTPWNIYKEEIKKVIIDEGITSIGSSIFYGCSSLSEVSVPASVNRIGALAFEKCTALKSITVDESSLYFYSDETGALYNADKTCLIQYPSSAETKSYKIIDGVTEIKESAFEGNKNLNSVILPESIKIISDNAFRSCENLIDISIPAKAESIGKNAFSATAIRSVTIPESLQYIGADAFSWCFDLRSISVNENNLSYSSDANGVLFNKAKTILIKFPCNSKQSSYSIPVTVTEIADNAFENCINLQSVLISENVQALGNGAFFNCSLKAVNVDDNNKNYSSDSFGALFDKNKTEFILYPIANERTSYKVPESVSSIKESAFHNARNLNSIVVADGVKSIEKGAFLYCTALDFIHIPESVTDIGDSIINTKTVICSESESSYAEEYAVTNGIEFNICANHNAKDIEISENKIEITNKQSYKLSANVIPDTAADKSIIWSSDNETIATVDGNGNVTAHSAGSAIITATATDGGYSATCQINVLPRYFYITWIIDDNETTEKIAEGNKIIAPAVEKEGYEFSGWSAEIPSVMPENNLIFNAKWTVNSYNAVFNANGGEWADGLTVKTLQFDYNEKIYAPRAPEKPGYEFAGWTPELGIMDSINGKEFTATWLPSNDTKYVVETYTMNLDGSYSVNEQAFAGTTDTTANAEYSVESGFMLNENKSFLFGNIEPDGSLVLKVYIDRLSFKVNLNGESLDLLFGEEIAEPEKPEAPTGHIQQGWIDENGNPVDFPLTVGLNLPASIKANFVKQSYTVTWVVNGIETEEIYEFDAEIIKPSTPKKTGYTFEGWTPDVPKKMPAYPLTFTAVWTADSFNAIFDANSGKWADGKTEKTVLTEFDAKIIAPEPPEKLGYIFSGWSPEVGIMDNINGKSFKAVWVASTDTKYTVEIYTMGTDGEYSKVIQTLSGATDSTAKVEYVLEEGYVLNGEKSILSGIISADNSLVLKVYIDRNSYSITTVVDGISNVANYLYGALIGELVAPEKKGYTFAGWDKTVPETMPAENLEFTASYTKNKYTCSDCGKIFDDESLYNEHLLFELSKKNIKISIKNNPESKTINYGETLKLTAVTSAVLPEGTSIIWYVDGAKAGEGQTFKLSFESGTKTVEVKIIDENGKALKDTEGNEILDFEKVSVNAGFFKKLISFFKNLFGSDRTIIQ